MNTNQEIQKDDEISLFELFTVLLRYRKLIIVVTVCAFVLAVAGYFFFPAFQYERAVKKRLTHGIMQMEILQNVQPYISFPLNSFLLRSDIIYDSLYVAGMDELSYKGGKISVADESNKTEVMFLINQFWLLNLDLAGNVFIARGKEHNKVFNVRMLGGGTNVAELTFKNKDTELVRKFLASMFALSTVRIEDNLRVSAQTMVNNYERFMNLPAVSDSIQMILERDFETYVFLKDFLDGKEKAVRLIDEPVLIDSVVPLSAYKRSYLNKALLIIFGGFFGSMLLALGLNVIRSIKNDEEAMKKIRDAMGNSGE